MGRQLRGGETIELISDLGGGKTAFVKGLAKGFGSSDTVRSPSFTLNNQYKSGELTLYHFDFYRLQEPGILQTELAEYVADNQSVVVIEWAGIVEDVLPTERMSIRLKPTAENKRDIQCVYPSNLSYLLHNT